MNLRRAADWNNVMAQIGKPKPTKADRPKKTPRPKNRRKILESQLEDICKAIVFWRDGAECVERFIDGNRCGGGIQWGHYIPRQQSGWLKYEIGNTFCQCRNHNNLHDKGSQTMAAWFGGVFGVNAQMKMEVERDAHRGKSQRTIQELEELLAYYDELYQNRFYVHLNLNTLMNAGYYGKIYK